MKKRPAWLLTVLLLTSIPAAAAVLLQPQSGERGLLLEVSESRAWLLRPNGQRLRLPVRRGETIEELVEFEGGWAATGGRALGGRGLDASREVTVIVDGAAGVERLRPVPDQIGNLRVRPVPMASAKRFEGLAWLEGDSPATYEVRVADWTGAVWGPPVTVSTARPGGQAGLVGTVLGDGRWLLVWSAADGRGGSRLLWSVREGSGRWSTPRGLTTAGREPDVTPSLVRAGEGALLIWARQQGGGYGLHTSRFDVDWAASRRFGSSVSWSPRFALVADAGSYVVHRSTAGWTAAEIDSHGREIRRAEVVSERRERPVVTATSGSIALRWERGEPARPVRWKGTP